MAAPKSTPARDRHPTHDSGYTLIYSHAEMVRDLLQGFVTVADVVSEHDLGELGDVRRRREEAVRWYASYRRATAASPDAAALTDEDIDRLVHEFR